MNILREVIQEFSPAQLKKDFALDARLLPSKWKRYSLYILLTIAVMLMSIAVLQHWYLLALLSTMFVLLASCLFLVKAYHYIQDKEDEQH